MEQVRDRDGRRSLAFPGHWSDGKTRRAVSLPRCSLREGPVLAMLALLRVAPLLPSPTLRAVPGVMPGRDGKVGSLIELES